MNIKERKAIDILGAGASGRALAFLLEKSGHQVRLLSRKGPIEKIKIRQQGEEHECYLNSGPGPAPVCLLTVPIHALAHLLDDLKDKKEQVFIPLSNAFLEKKFYASPFFPGVNYVASTYDRNTDFVEIFSSDLGICLEKRFTDAFQENLSFVNFCNDIRKKRAKKFFINLVINTICAAFDLEHNKLVRQQSIFSQIKNEALDVTDQLYSLENIGCSSKKEALGLLEIPLSILGQNTNSMVQALRRGARTEAEFLSGYASPEKHPGLFELHQNILSKYRQV